MECLDPVVFFLSGALITGGALFLWAQTRRRTAYGRYVSAEGRCCPARLGWFLQEVPAFLLPLLLLLLTADSLTGRTSICFRSFIYALRTRGRPVPLTTVLYAAIFCSLNGFLQGHHLLHCARFDHTWLSRARMAAGSLLFVVGLSINIHSDLILRRLREPGEVVYRIPHGGMFHFVSGANFFGEIVEWSGYAIASWSLPTFAFAFFTVCSIGPRAFHHHRDYQQRFDDYPRSRKILIPFIL
uniref:Steroid-5-alpha-reductase, alpha polypeptide 2a n=1 Tax=Scophthalmus maximus TaxID=52904 RepID=A0A8D3CX96_SCOMX